LGSAVPAVMKPQGRSGDSTSRLKGFSDFQQAGEALEMGKIDKAQDDLIRGLGKLLKREIGSDEKRLFIQWTFTLSDVSQMTGFMATATPYLLLDFLETACRYAEESGNDREKILLRLHIARVFYFSNRIRKAIRLFSSNIRRMKQYRDADMEERAAGLVGLYHFVKGRYPEAMRHFGSLISATGDPQKNWTTPILEMVLYGYSDAMRGNVKSGLGSMAFALKMTERMKNTALATAVQGFYARVLVFFSRFEEAHRLLTRLLAEARSSQNFMAEYAGLRSLICLHYRQGDFKSAHQASLAFRACNDSRNFKPVIFSHWVLEAYAGLEQAGYAPEGGWRFSEAFPVFMRSQPSIHLRGVALRLKAVEEMAHFPKGRADTMKKLRNSLRFLELSGDEIQLSKTRIETARFHLLDGDVDAARAMTAKAASARTDLTPEVPEDLAFLLESTSIEPAPTSIILKLLRKLRRFLDELPADADSETLVNNLMQGGIRFLKPGRAGIFERSPDGNSPVLLKGFNLSQDDVGAPDFHNNLAPMQDAVDSQRPIWIWKERPPSLQSPQEALFHLYLPIEESHPLPAALYFEDCTIPGMAEAEDELIRHTADLLMSITRKASKCLQVIHRSRRREFEKSVCREARGEPPYLTDLPDMNKTFRQAEDVAPTDVSVLIRGETGTGKEVLARWIHHHSPRRKGPFIVIDPGNMPESIVESAFFGHEKGSFTGAHQQRIGFFELADGGTLFIDEIGDIPMLIQGKLLRVLAEKTFTRIGKAGTIRSDFRLLAATNRNLRADIKNGHFREDLFYRINVLETVLPPLRDRKMDIMVLTEHFLSFFKLKYRRPRLRLSASTRRRITEYDWPGNARELKNTVERAVLTSGPKTEDPDILITDRRLPEDILHESLPTMDQLQRRYIEHILKNTGGKISGAGGAAEILGMKRTTLQARIKKLGVRVR